MRGISIDAGERTARVEAGVLDAGAGRGRGRARAQLLSRLLPDVGVVGYTLGGGLGWLGRQYGLSCNSVTGDRPGHRRGRGEARSTATDDPDLFWALRGGGGGYAIVTALHLSLLPIADIYAGIMIFPAELGAVAFRAYRDWAATAPEEVTAIIRLLRPPPVPDVPEPLRGGPLITIDAAFIGGREAGEELIAPLRAIGEPIMDNFDQIPAAGLCRIHRPRAAGPRPRSPRADPRTSATRRSTPSSPTGPARRPGSTLLLAELRQLGGALGRHSEGAGALDMLDFPFVMSAIGAPMAPDAAETVAPRPRPHRPGDGARTAAGGYFNFVDRPCDADSILPADTCTRLAEVKRQWDPEGTIVANHAVSLDPAA